MLLGIGNKVRFIHTGAKGKIVDRLDNGMFVVEVLEGVEIPAFAEYLERIEDELRPSSVKAKIIRRPSNQLEKPNIPGPQRQYEVLKGEGVQMAFEHKEDGSMQRYAVYLLNDTAYQGLYEITISIKGAVVKKVNGIVESLSFVKLMEMPSDYLSDNPLFEINCRQKSTEGMTDWLNKGVKLKPKQFFSKKKTAVLLNKPAYVYKLFEPYQLKKKTETLASYTKKKLLQKPIKSRGKEAYYDTKSILDIQKFANFPIEKDLHIEKLVEKPTKMSSKDMLRLQITSFNNYLEDAIRLGIKKVFIIHGHGKGRLKNEIATILMQYPEVKTFKNEYHPKYGSGATEVFFEED